MGRADRGEARREYLEQPVEVNAGEDAQLTPECDVQGRPHAAR